MQSDSALFNLPFLIATIISIVTLILYFKISFDIGAIKRKLVEYDSSILIKKSKKYEFIGKNEKAKDTIMEYIFEVKNDDKNNLNQKKIIIKKLVERINKLGFPTPENLKEFI
jgi:hypothetical protein